MKENDSLFPLPPNKLPPSISTVKHQSICTVFIRQETKRQQTIQQFELQQYHNRIIELVICGQYVIERDPNTKQPNSGFLCQFDVKFWLIRSPSITSNTIGKLQGIAFQFPQAEQETKSHIISLFLPQQLEQQSTTQLEHFCSILQKKYIVQKQFHLKYKAIKRIGKGLTAIVYSSLCLVDRSQVAIKSFKKQIYFSMENGNGRKGFLKQFKILTQLKCKYLSCFLGVYESDHSIYIVQQLLDRTLYNYLQRFGFPQTIVTRRLLYKLLIGLKFLHKKNIMHRDIKLENIMIRGLGKDDVEPVIVDFGLAQYIGDKQFVYIRCGTPGYVAPEIINLNKDDKTQIKYDKSCDVFSLGVIFHVMLLGKSVFEGEDVRIVVEKNKLCNIDYDFTNYPLMAPEPKDLLKGMLLKDPSKRYTIDELMDHAFFVQEKEFFAKEVEEMQQIWILTKKESEEETRMKEEKEE